MTNEQRRWFDEPVNRRGTDSVKWDKAGDGEIPMWIADMDFKAAPCIQKALQEKLEQGVFGYTLIGERFNSAIQWWFSHKYGWSIDSGSIIPIGGLVAGASVVLKALTEPGDEVLFLNPAYNCFFSSIRNVGCKPSPSCLRYSDEGRAEIDWEDFEAKAKTAKVYLGCNPHNPSGRLWTREELEKIAEICHRHEVAMISDEIHSELTAPGTVYTPMATIDPKTISLVSCTKSWNVAGLAVSALIVPEEADRERVSRVINTWEHCDLNQFGPAALQAAYSPEGEEWLDALREYLWENYDFMKETFARELPQCKVSLLEATYLPWVDIRGTGIGSEELCRQLREKHGVWVNPGTMYGEDGFVRINIACPRSILTEGLSRIVEGIQKLTASQAI